MAKQSLSQSKSHHQAAKILFEVDRAAKADVLRAESAVAGAELLVERTSNLTALAEDRLRTLLADPATARYEIGEDLMGSSPRQSEKLDFASLYAESLRQRLEPRALEKAGLACRVVDMLDVAQEGLTELEKQVGSVKVKGAQGTRVRIDDHMELGAPATLHAGAGEHTLVITRADGSSETRKLAFEAGKSIEVDTGAEPELQPETKKVKRVTLSETRKAPVDEPSTGPSPWKTVGFIGIGAGVAALGGALVLGLSAKDAEDTYKKRPTRETLDLSLIHISEPTRPY